MPPPVPTWNSPDYVWDDLTIDWNGNPVSAYAWSLWDGAVEQPLTLEGVWDGASVVPATVEQVT